MWVDVRRSGMSNLQYKGKENTRFSWLLLGLEGGRCQRVRKEVGDPGRWRAFGLVRRRGVGVGVVMGEGGAAPWGECGSVHEWWWSAGAWGEGGLCAWRWESRGWGLRGKRHGMGRG